MYFHLPSGKHTKNYGQSPLLMGKLTISMAIFNSYVSLPEGNGKLSVKVAVVMAKLSAHAGLSPNFLEEQHLGIS